MPPKIYISNKNKRKISGYFYFLISFFVFFSVAVIIYGMNQIFLPIDNLPADKTFVIDKGQGGDEILNNLKSGGYIKSIFWSKVALHMLAAVGLDNKFYRGEYNFDKTFSAYGIIHAITKRPVSLAVLIPEGFTKAQIADRLAKYIVKFDRTDFLKRAPEGYLFPDTYYFYSFSTDDEILQEFSDRFNGDVYTKFGKLPTKEQVIIASMLEREAKDPNDMKIISGIIQNRLKLDMPLQIDATVLYGKGAWKDRVFYSDLSHDSDYNTYLNKGLPIGPISNPGLDALYAAMYPADTDYVYYLTGRDGKMYYAKTGVEHNRNVALHLR